MFLLSLFFLSRGGSYFILDDIGKTDSMLMTFSEDRKLEKIYIEMLV